MLKANCYWEVACYKLAFVFKLKEKSPHLHPLLSILETESSYGHFGDDSFLYFCPQKI